LEEGKSENVKADRGKNPRATKLPETEKTPLFQRLEGKKEKKEQANGQQVGKKSHSLAHCTPWYGQYRAGKKMVWVHPGGKKGVGKKWGNVLTKNGLSTAFGGKRKKGERSARRPALKRKKWARQVLRVPERGNVHAAKGAREKKKPSRHLSPKRKRVSTRGNGTEIKVVGGNFKRKGG